MNILLCGLQSPINCGMILRSAEIYGHSVAVHDAFATFVDARKRETISDFACGALQRHAPAMVDDLMIHLRAAPARIVATTIAGDAHSAQDFDWRMDDVLLIGNEYDGLSEPVADLAHSRVRIPMPPGHFPKPRSIHPIDRQRDMDVSRNGAPSLNTAVATSILCFLSYLRSSGAVCGASAD